MAKTKKSKCQFDVFCDGHMFIESGLRPLFNSIEGSANWNFTQLPPWFDNLIFWVKNRPATLKVLMFLHTYSQPAIQNGSDAVCRYLQLLSASILTRPERYVPQAGTFLGGIYYLHFPVKILVDHLKISRRKLKAVIAELESFGAVRYIGSGPGDFESIGLCYGTLAFIFGQYSKFPKFVPRYIRINQNGIQVFRRCCVSSIENYWKAFPGALDLDCHSEDQEVKEFHKKLSEQVKILIPIKGLGRLPRAARIKSDNVSKRVA